MNIALCRFHAPPAMQAYPRTAHCPALSKYECAEKRVLLQYQSRPSDSGVLNVADFSLPNSPVDRALENYRCR
ncbi:hypothetical protein CY34DRAFT_811314 [Suillus luteus UH-Slu-Lm8-n1]|uniref:Uncharacterized protein n=1 Tax=Suillus luteus UH-Slu-Lm8-n1 TaxID=930992 RepID=A0A0D0AE20_9AGAM|nr:hypothetical protein CY34DRAFT_811314 [Suillus luteus UH-Slu-Lm8-n1]